MKRLYGAEGEKVGRAAVMGASPGIWETDKVARFPLVEDIVQGASGVIVHSEFLKTYISNVFGGPIERLSLPYGVSEVPSSITRETFGISQDCILILTVGHVNPNKCVADILQALGRISSIGHDYLYVVVGSCPPEYRNELEEIADRNGISAHVRWMGEVDDETLRGFLQYADICLNLRFPAIEGASASVIEQMKSGKAVIVNDTGFFSELPASAVVKVEPKNLTALTRELARLFSDPQARQELGRQARQFAQVEFDADRYAAGVVQLASEVKRAAPLMRVADRVANEFKQMGVVGGSSLVRSTAREIFTLFCENAGEP
jgi:glycosyltransferase involved in cell wall biosynthesis